MKKLRFAFALTLLFALIITLPQSRAEAQDINSLARNLGPFGLSISLINDEVWMFELSEGEAPQATSSMSMMIAPDQVRRAPAASGDSLNSASMSVNLTQNPPLITVNLKDGRRLFAITPYAPDGRLAGISFNGAFSHLVGLGSNLSNSYSSFNLIGSNVLPANPFGNGQVTVFGSNPNQTQIPVVYALGEALHCGAIFIDETRPLQWSLNSRPWTVSTAGPLGPERSIRFFVIGGDRLADLRSNFMNLTGKPPVPPNIAMGVWATNLKSISEVDFQEKASYLKANVPALSGLLIPGEFALGGIMAAAKALDLGLVVDESAYLPQESPHYTDMARRSFLVRQGSAGGQISIVNHQEKPSAIIDYSNSSAAAFWHSLERMQLVAEGLSCFRLTDGHLPEASPEGWYQSLPDSLTHSHYAWNNLLPLKWQEGLINSVANQRLRNRSRLFLLSSSGLAGLTRLSGALYNSQGALFINRSALAARAHLALAGVDFYSSDIAHNLPSWPVDQNSSIYDAWLAKSCLTDIPLLLPEDMLLRPSARYNLALRESLAPYYYSLSWEANKLGQPILAPLAYHFQEDLSARSRVGELMLGPSLLIGLDFDGSSERANVYVPQGRWYNWRSGEVIDQKDIGGLVSMDIKDAGQLTPPILARAGAIVPAVEELSIKGGNPQPIATLKIFIGSTSSEFAWYEDDGQSLDYQRNQYGRTDIRALTNPDGSTVVTIKAREGSWAGAPAERRLLIDIYGPSSPGEATLDGMPHNRVARSVELDQLESGWASIGTNRIRFKTPLLETSVDHVLWFK